MKVVERIFEYRIRQQIEIDDMHFGYMKGKGTTDAIFMARQMQENFRVKGKKLYFGFVDLEKAFDRVPREVIRWAMGSDVYVHRCKNVRTVYGNSKGLEVKVGMHQGSALSPLLFVIVMEVIPTIYQPFNGRLFRTTWVGRYQKKHSPTHTHPDQRTSFITFLHLQRSTASSLFSLRA